EQAMKFAETATRESSQAVKLSPANVNLKRERASMFIKLSIIEPGLLIYAKNTLEQAVLQAPTSAKLFYNLALANLRTGETEKAIEILQETILMKPNYRNAYFALGLIYIDENETELTKQQFKYILENLEPNDTEVQRELDELN
ncbi:tetratricopeptide repeat protein, partial [Patescibacteria group bacterium]|nr:tetratricopeptide repeat protein [Patescibacteria group bacterium]